MKLYDNNNKTEVEAKESKKRVEILSIEYNPLNQISKDLGLSNIVIEKDHELLKYKLTSDRLKDKYGGNRVVKGSDLLKYSFFQNFKIVRLRNYRAFLTEKALQAIKDFVDRNKINIQHDRDCFYILAPAHTFEKENLDLSNIKFNIYYSGEYLSEGVKANDVLVEVYGSDLKYSKLSTFLNVNRPIMKIDSGWVVVYAITIGLLLTVNVITLTNLIVNSAITSSGLKLYSILNLLTMLCFIYSYKQCENKISKIIDEI